MFHNQNKKPSINTFPHRFKQLLITLCLNQEFSTNLWIKINKKNRDLKLDKIYSLIFILFCDIIYMDIK